MAIFKDPPVVRRIAHLRVGEKIWIYFGKINRTKEISAKAAFAESTLAEEDLLSVSLGYYYNLEKVEEVELDGRKVLKLTLKSPSKETAYYKIESFIDSETFLPIKRYYYSFSNHKIREMKVIEIKKEGEKTKYIRFVMYDLLRKGTYTEVEIKDFEYFSDLSDKMFTKKYMEIAVE